MTNHWNDIDNASCVFVMGANPAENHPACMAHVNAARDSSKHAKLVVVDPRKTRTAVQADTYVRIRPGTDIAFFNGVLKWIMDNIATAYPTAWANMQTFHNSIGANQVAVNRTFVNDAGASVTFTAANMWSAHYEGEDTRFPFRYGATVDTDAGFPKYTDARIKVDPTKKDYVRKKLIIGTNEFSNFPYFASSFDEAGTVYSTLGEHVDSYPVNVVSDICGCTTVDIATIAKIVIEHSRFSSSDFGAVPCTPNDASYKALTWLYAMGQTQHTYGSQNIRGGAILQTLMGNMGRPGGGVNALRGIHNVQGSTDFGLLFDAIPAYSGNPGQDDTYATYTNALFGNRLVGGGKNWTTTPYVYATGATPAYTNGLQQLGFRFMTQKFFGPADTSVTAGALTVDATVAPASVFTMGETINVSTTATPDNRTYYGFASPQIVNRIPDANTGSYLVTVAAFKRTVAEVTTDPTLPGIPANWDTLVFRTSNPGVRSAYTFVGLSNADATFRTGATGKTPDSGAYVNDGDVYYAFIAATDGTLWKMSSTDGLAWTFIGQANGTAGDPQLIQPRVIRDGLGGFWVWGVGLGADAGKILYARIKKNADGTFTFENAAGTAHAFDVVSIDGAPSASDASPFVVSQAGVYQLYWSRGGDLYMAMGTKRTAFLNATLIHDSSAVGGGGTEYGVIAGGSSLAYMKYSNPAPGPQFFPFNDVKSIQKPWVDKLDALFSVWPKNNGYDHITSFRKMQGATPTVKACYVLGQNPAVTEPNQSEVRDGLYNLELLVVQDMFKTETAEVKRQPDGITYLLPACAHPEEAGSVTNSGRWLQWRQKARAPKGNSKADLELILRLSKALDTAGAFNHITTMWTAIGYTSTDRWQDLFGRYAKSGTTLWNGTSSIEGVSGARNTGVAGTTVLTGTEYVADVIFEEMCKPNVAADAVTPTNPGDGGTMWIYCNAYNSNRASARPGTGTAVANLPANTVAVTDEPLTLTGVAQSALYGIPTGAAPTITLTDGTPVAAGDVVVTGALIRRSDTSTLTDPVNVLVDYSYDGNEWPEANRAKARNKVLKGVANNYPRWGWAWLYNRRVFYNNSEVPMDEADNFVAPGFLARLYVNATNTFADYASGLQYRAYSTLADKPSLGTAVGQVHYHTGRFPGHTEPLESPRDGTNAALGTNLVSAWGRNLWSDGNGKAHPTAPTTADGQTLDTNVGSALNYPLVLTTIRCVEHFQGGPITRNNSYNVEAEPQPWIEINSLDARKYGISDGDMVNITTARSNSTSDQLGRTKYTRRPSSDPDYDVDNFGRGFIARVGVGTSASQRVGPGVVAIPWHWGDQGLSTGSRANDLCVDAFDANTRIPEYKACLCKIEKITS